MRHYKRNISYTTLESADGNAFSGPVDITPPVRLLPAVSAATKPPAIVPCALTEELRLTGPFDRVIARTYERQKADGDLIVGRLLGVSGGRVQ